MSDFLHHPSLKILAVALATAGDAARVMTAFFASVGTKIHLNLPAVQQAGIMVT